MAAAAVAALLLAACGDDASDDGAGLGTQGGGVPAPTEADAGLALTVEAHDIEFDRETYRIAAGPVDIEYQQRGAVPHSLVIEEAGGVDVDGFKLEVGDADVDRGTVDLSPGEYVIYCDVAGHRDAGMEAELQVE